MPNRPAKPCNHPGCPALIYDGSGHCEKHKKAIRKESDQRRGTSTQRGYNAKWGRLSRARLRDNPWCVSCLKKKRLTAATITDHIKPHKGDMVKFWDYSNHQSLCKPCHDKKTASEDGGFGNLRDELT